MYSVTHAIQRCASCLEDGRVNMKTSCMHQMQATHPQLFRNVDPIDLPGSTSRHELLHPVDLGLRPLGIVESRMALAYPLDLTCFCRPEVAAQTRLGHLRRMTSIMSTGLEVISLAFSALWPICAPSQSQLCFLQRILSCLRFAEGALVVPCLANLSLALRAKCVSTHRNWASTAYKR